MKKLKVKVINNNSNILDYGVIIGNKEDLYVIRCRYYRKTEKNIFFENFIFDKNNNEIKDNTIVFNDLKCEIIKQDTWSNIIENY